MKYTKALWNSNNFHSYKLIRGKYRDLKRAMLIPSQLGYESICVCLSLMTIPVDLYKSSRFMYIKYSRLKRKK